MPIRRATRTMWITCWIMVATIVSLWFPTLAQAYPAAAGQRGTPVPPMTWGICGFRTPETKVIRTFNRYRAGDGSIFMRGGYAYLLCGTTNFGYWHILTRHMQDWQKKAFLSGDNWRDLADSSIAAVLADPDVTKYRPENNTFCYSAEIYLFNNQTRKAVSITYPNIVVGAQNNQIVTAYPSKSQCD